MTLDEGKTTYFIDLPTKTTGCTIEPYENSFCLYFDEPPRIRCREDALYLLDRMLAATTMEHYDLALEALRDAVDQGVLCS